MVIGIDIGGSTTDIVGFEDKNIQHCCTVRADDPVSSAAGALGRFLMETDKRLEDIASLAVTGVGAGALKSELLGVPVHHVDEFRAIGCGGVFLSGVREAVVASMGTGTAIVQVRGNQILHWGGSGVGGGTVVGLSKALFGVSDIDIIARKAALGHLDRVDLSVGDISTGEIPGLPPETTAANFAKMRDDVTDDDLATAVVNMVCQTVGMIAVGAAGATGHSTVVLIGKLATFPTAEHVFRQIAELNGRVEFMVAPHAWYATAVGAAVAANQQNFNL